MDYLKDYKSIIKKESVVLKEFIVETLTNEKVKGRRFDKALSNLQNLFYEKFINQSLLNKYSSYFEPMRNDLAHHTANYDPSKFDSMLKTLEIEIYKRYLGIIETFRTYNIDPDFSENMNYEKFYPKILKYFLYKRVYNRLDKSIFHLTEAFKLFYKIDDYSELKTSYLIDEEEKVTELVIHNIFKKYGQKLELKKSTSKSKNEKSIIEEIKSTFDENEKIILLHLTIFQGDKIEKTEKLKLILLTGELTDYSIFEGPAKDSTFYKKISAGINHYGKKSQIKYLDSILNKIETLELKTTKEQLRSLKGTAIHSK